MAYQTISYIYHLSKEDADSLSAATHIINEIKYVDDAMFVGDSGEIAITLAKNISDLLIVGEFLHCKMIANDINLLNDISLKWLDT